MNTLLLCFAVGWIGLAFVFEAAPAWYILQAAGTSGDGWTRVRDALGPYNYPNMLFEPLLFIPGFAAIAWRQNRLDVGRSPTRTLARPASWCGEKEWHMSRLKLLQIALMAFGVVFCLVYPLAIIWPSGWAWHDGPPAASYYFMMIVGIYATLGLFLIRASRDPLAHRSLIDFTIWSSVVHALIMAVQSLGPGVHMGHMLGDVPALLLVAAVLGGLTYSGSLRPARG